MGTLSSARKTSSKTMLVAITVTAVLACTAVFNAIPATKSSTASVTPKPINSSRSTDIFFMRDINLDLD